MRSFLCESCCNREQHHVFAYGVLPNRVVLMLEISHTTTLRFLLLQRFEYKATCKDSRQEELWTEDQKEFNF